MVQISRLQDEVIDGVAERQLDVELLLDLGQHPVRHLVHARLHLDLPPSRCGRGWRSRGRDATDAGSVLNLVQGFFVGDPASARNEGEGAGGQPGVEGREKGEEQGTLKGEGRLR